MIIGINGFEAVIPRFGYNPNGLPNRVGSSEVGFELLLKLSEIDKNNEYVIYLPSFPTPDMPKESERWHYEIVPNVPLWTILGLGRKLLVKPRLDVFFSPSHYGPLFTSCPQVITILDLSYKYFPELFKKSDLLKLALWGKYSIKKAAKIITISQSSRNDIIKEYRAGPDKVSVVYPGIKQVSSSKYKVFSMKQLTEKYGINSPFILFVGTLQPRKNISRLIEAFFRMVSNGDLMDSNLQLVIIGRRGWKYEEILEAPKKFGVEDKVLFLDNVTDEDLPEFYKDYGGEVISLAVNLRSHLTLYTEDDLWQTKSAFPQQTDPELCWKILDEFGLGSMHHAVVVSSSDAIIGAGLGTSASF
ncbi:MAG: Glycosyl transferase group 1, partial [Candidatus Levybacteria bacterium GW2011_GWB1_39_7]